MLVSCPSDSVTAGVYQWYIDLRRTDAAVGRGDCEEFRFAGVIHFFSTGNRPSTALSGFAWICSTAQWW